MKKFKNLYYTGLAIISLPIVAFFIIFLLSHNESKVKKDKKEVKPILYDTVKVKVKIYDTVVVEKIKYVKKVKPESDSLGNQSSNQPN